MRCDRTRLSAACRAALAALPAALLVGCKTLPVADTPFAAAANGTEKAETQDVGTLPAPQPRTWPDASTDVLNQRARGYGLVHMPRMQAYLNGLLARIKKQAGVADWPGTVHITATSSLDAFATAAGNIYLSPAWLSLAESEDELVAVLAHEFGHVYLHYHQLEGAVQDADNAMAVAALAFALTRKAGAPTTGWTQLDSLLATYAAGRSLSTSAWGRSQELAADRFALVVGNKLGYSYEHGMKAFLERLDQWETDNGKRKQELEEKVAEQLRQQSRANTEAAARKSTPDPNPLVLEIGAKIDESIAMFFHAAGKGAKDLVEGAITTHPSAAERSTEAWNLTGKLPAGRSYAPPVTKALLQARSDKQTADVLGNYQLASKALENLDSPNALNDARRAASGPTATHALPLLAYYKALLAHPVQQRGRTPAADPGTVLDANLASASDKALAVYLERSRRFQVLGRNADAKKVLDGGVAFFDAAPEAWPEIIQFQGQTQGWATAKLSAQRCSTRFKPMAQRCNQAALTPSERAEELRKSEEKGRQLANKLIPPK